MTVSPLEIKTTSSSSSSSAASSPTSLTTSLNSSHNRSSKSSPQRSHCTVTPPLTSKLRIKNLSCLSKPKVTMAFQLLHKGSPPFSCMNLSSISYANCCSPGFNPCQAISNSRVCFIVFALAARCQLSQFNNTFN